MRHACLVLVGAALGACVARTPPTSPAEIATRAGVMAPADPRLADLYAHACRACHAKPGTGAPLAGDRDAWGPRVRQGLAVLTTHAATGYRGMPAGGQCFSCTVEDYQSLIRFMVDQPVS